jgi:hypothetical protein
MGGVYVYGDKWAVEAETPSIADKVKEKAGSDLGPTGARSRAMPALRTTPG